MKAWNEHRELSDEERMKKENTEEIETKIYSEKDKQKLKEYYKNHRYAKKRKKERKK